MGVVAGLAAAASAASLAGSVSNLASGGPSVSGGPSGGSISGYQPTGQPQADQLYQNIFNQMGTGAMSLPNVSAAYQNYAGNLQGNPYYAGLQLGVNNAAAYGAGGFGPPGGSQFAPGTAIYGGAGQAGTNASDTTAFGAGLPISVGGGLSAVPGAGGIGSAGLGGLAGQQANAANQLFAAGGQGLPYGSQILQTGFDPQNALYNRMAQQTTDQANAINSMYGLSSSPAGAGLADQALSNFNIDWQNNLLNRQLQASQGYGNLISGAGRALAGGSDLGGSALQTAVTSAQLPYQTYVGFQTDAMNAANNLVSGITNSYGLDQNTLNALAAYLRLGQSATGIGQAGQQQAFNQNQTTGAQLGSALNSLSNNQGLANLFGGGGTSGGSSLYSNTFSDPYASTSTDYYSSAF